MASRRVILHSTSERAEQLVHASKVIQDLNTNLIRRIPGAQSHHLINRNVPARRYRRRLRIITVSLWSLFSLSSKYQ